MKQEYSILSVVSLVREMDARSRRKIYHTGTIGRPSAMHLILRRARSRLAAGDYPKSRLEFSRQLAEELAKTDPEAPRTTEKTIYNSVELRGLWNKRVPKIIGRS